MNALHFVPTIIVVVKYFVETAVELWSHSIIERYQAAETDRVVNAGKHWHSNIKDHIHEANQNSNILP